MTQQKSNEPAKIVTVFGGSGFVGRYVVRALALRGYRVRVAVRRPDLAGFLLPDGAVGQIALMQSNVRYPVSVARAVAGADAVINLVGILKTTGRQSFDGVQAFGARAIAKAASDAGITNVVHVSAIGADAQSASHYARTKAEGEAAVLAAVPSAVVLRPSVVFGPEDNFFNMFGTFAAHLPALPLIGGGTTLFQPIYVNDLANAVVAAIDGAAKPGTVYELGGTQVLSFKALMETVKRYTRRSPMLVSIPFGIAKLQAALTEWIPGAPLTQDQVELLKSDNIVSKSAQEEGRTLAGLGVSATSLAAVLPTYLYRFLPNGQYDATKSAVEL